MNTDSPSNPITNWITIVGGQGQCLPGDELRCGDGQLAQRAQLIQPKGVAVSAEGHIVFVDGTTIRKVREVYFLIFTKLKNSKNWIKDSISFILKKTCII